MTPVEVVVLSALFTIVGSFVSWFLARRERKDKDRYTSQTPTPPSTQEVWRRLDDVEQVVRSAVVLLGEVADQWTADHPPVLSKRHVAILSAKGYMPPEWDPQVE